MRKRSLAYLSFLKLGLDIVTDLRDHGTCGCVEGNLSDQINLDAGLLLYNFHFFGRPGYLFFNNFNKIFHDAALASLAIENMDGEGAKEILSFDINLPIIHGLEFLNGIPILMLADSLNFE